MKICQSIIQHINIEPGAILPCCKPFIHNIPQSAFTGYDNLKRYIAALQSCLEEYHDFCDGCQHRETYDVKSSNIKDMLDISLILINHHRNFCNCKCVYCPYWQTPARPISVRPLLDELLSSGIVNKNAVVSWGGGESALLPEFEDTAFMLLGKGMYQQILANALRYSAATASILENANGGIMVSLDSGTRKTYCAIKGVDGFNAAHGTLKRYAAAARHIQDITVKYIIFDVNNTRSEIDAFFALCSTLGQVTVSSAFDAYQIADLSVSQASKDTLHYFRQQAQKKGHPYYDWSDLMHPGLSDAVTGYNGSVYYYGGGDFYDRHKHLFSHCSPRYILLDKNPGKLDAIDGIPVRHPAEVLPQEERLPIVVFAWDQAPITHTLATTYPWYTRVGPQLWLPLADRNPRDEWLPVHRRKQ